MEKTHRTNARIRNGLNRRQMLSYMAGVSAFGMLSSANGQTKKTETKGRLNQSIAYWCFSKYWDIEQTCKIARQLGCKSVELIEPKDWPTLKKHGLVCALANSHWFEKGMNNPKYHEMCLSKIREGIDACAEFGFPNVITFTGLAEDITPEDGIKNCVAGYKKIQYLPGNPEQSCACRNGRRPRLPGRPHRLLHGNSQAGRFTPDETAFRYLPRPDNGW
ncbi:MAG: hypothetical protein ACYSTT_04430 [Planctomycetota bacterium]|jgi:hydroxypyruvate isomerase